MFQTMKPLWCRQNLVSSNHSKIKKHTRSSKMSDKDDGYKTETYSWGDSEESFGVEIHTDSYSHLVLNQDKIIPRSKLPETNTYACKQRFRSKATEKSRERVCKQEAELSDENLNLKEVKNKLLVYKNALREATEENAILRSRVKELGKEKLGLMNQIQEKDYTILELSNYIDKLTNNSITKALETKDE